MAPKAIRQMKPGRPEYITFDTMDGFCIVFAENVSMIDAAPNEGADPANYGVRFCMKRDSGVAYADKMGLTLKQQRQLVTFMLRTFCSGPVVRGNFLDLDFVLTHLARAENLPPEYPEGDKPTLVGPDGEPVESGGPRIVPVTDDDGTPTMDGVTA